MDTIPAQYKYVFVCGLQRSGTSILARNIGRLRGCTVFKDTGAIEDEGQYLQDVYPTNNELGGTGWYGFNARAHLTENSDLLTPENAFRLRSQWHRLWDAAEPICVEKTPGNLLMTRFLQAVFPNSYFIVVKRHPIAVSMANQRWKKSMASLRMGFEHWLHCYGLYEVDRQHLRHLYELRYEDYITDPHRFHREIAEFIGTDTNPGEMEPLAGTHNSRYFKTWRKLIRRSPFRDYYRYLTSAYQPRFVPCGYSLTQFPGQEDELSAVDITHSVFLGKAYCAGADAHAAAWRLLTRAKGMLRRSARQILPSAMKERLRRVFPKPPFEGTASRN